jgi:hypothetical protein
MNILDVLNGDAFSFTNMSRSIEVLPYKPNRITRLGLFNDTPISTLTAMIERRDGVLSLIPPTPRGTMSAPVGTEKAKVRSFVVPHFQRPDGINADALSGARKFGTTDQTESVAEFLARRMLRHKNDLELTMESLKLGALKGVITYADSTTLNLFTEFGLTQEPTVFFDLVNASPAAGALREKCDDVSRRMAEVLGAGSFEYIHAFCGSGFMKKLVKHKDIIESAKADSVARAVLLASAAPDTRTKQGKQIAIGDIIFEEYVGFSGGNPAVGAEACHMFPVGVPNLFDEYIAPADYVETVNTLGQRFYAKQERMRFDLGIELHVQSNVLPLCNRPEVLFLGSSAAS